MALINWNDNLSVKVKKFDQDHQKLISLINGLNDGMMQGKGKDVLGEILNELIIYTRTHFKAEERCFAKFGYPKADSHKEEHDAFVKKVSDFKDGFERGEISLTIAVMRFLKDWLQNHINGTDKNYSQFFNEKGLS